MASSSSLPGFSARDNPYANISCLLAQPNTFLLRGPPGESSCRTDPDRTAHGFPGESGCRDGKKSAPPSLPSSRRSSDSSSSRRSRAKAEESSEAVVEGLTANGARQSEPESEEGGQVSGAPSQLKRVYNICKNKRVSLRKLEVKKKEEIVADPDIIIDQMVVPRWVQTTPDLWQRLRGRLYTFQQQVLAGENPDPTLRHPSTREMAATAATRQGSRA